MNKPQGVVLRRLGAREHVLTVVGKEYRAEHFVRVWLRSESLLAGEGEAPGNWVRAWFPDPDGGSREFQRGYTIVEADPVSGEFAIDWTAISFVDGSEKLELWFRLPSWFSPFLMDFVRGTVPDRGMKPGLIVAEFNP